MAQAENILLDVTNLTVSYDRHPALHHISCQFTAGGLYAITGPNGGGKSTLLKILAGIMRANQGSLTWQGDRPRRVAWLPQQTPMMRQFPLSVLEVVAMGHWPHIRLVQKNHRPAIRSGRPNPRQSRLAGLRATHGRKPVGRANPAYVICPSDACRSRGDSAR